MNKTTDIIDALKNLNNMVRNNEQKSEEKQVIVQNKLDEKTPENKTICRLVNLHMDYFFDDIYVPYNFFKANDWKISKVLYDNEDALFFNNKYLTKEDEERFYEVFDKYISMIEEILTPDNKLCIFLKKWTDMTEPRWKAKNKSYLKSLLIDDKYQYISPVYITNIYCDLNKKYKTDNDKIKQEIEKHLDGIVKKVKKEIHSFRKSFDEIIFSYVYEHPSDPKEKNVYSRGLINSVMVAILNFTEKLIDLNVYAVHPIIVNVTDYYLPLDRINEHQSNKNRDREIYIV